MCPTDVGSEDATLLIAEHTAEDTSQSSVRNFIVESAVSSSALGLSPPMAGETLCKETNTRNLAEQEKYFRSCQPGETLRKTISTTVRPHKDYQSQENYRRLQHSPKK